jgi:hypothetical protein
MSCSCVVCGIKGNDDDDDYDAPKGKSSVQLDLIIVPFADRFHWITSTMAYETDDLSDGRVATFYLCKKHNKMTYDRQGKPCTHPTDRPKELYYMHLMTKAAKSVWE